MFKNIIVIAGMLVSSIELTHADRDGFLLSAGLGLNSNYLAFNNDNGNFDLESSWGAASQLKIGGVINHQHAV